MRPFDRDHKNGVSDPRVCFCRNRCGPTRATTSPGFTSKLTSFSTKRQTPAHTGNETFSKRTLPLQNVGIMSGSGFSCTVRLDIQHLVENALCPPPAPVPAYVTMPPMSPAACGNGIQQKQELPANRRSSFRPGEALLLSTCPAITRLPRPVFVITFCRMLPVLDQLFRSSRMLAGLSSL